MNKTVLTSFTILCLSSTMFLIGLAFNIQPVKAEPLPKVYVDPAECGPGPNNYFTIDINIANVSDLYSWELSLEWDASLLNVTAISEGSFLKSRGKTYFVGPPKVPLEQAANNIEGRLSIGCILMGEPATAAATGSGTLANVTFVVKQGGECNLHLHDTTLVKMISVWETEAIPHTTQDGYFSAVLYYELLESYYMLLLDFNALNATYYELVVDNENLNSTYHALLSNYTELQTNYVSLQTSYDNLQASYNALNITYHELLINYNSLNSNYTTLQDSYDKLQSDQEAITNELSTTRNLMYIFIATTIILIATTVYFAKRKPKTRKIE